MKTLMLGAALFVGAVGLAGQNQTDNQHEMRPQMQMQMQMMQGCSMRIQGAKMAAADTATGIAVTITTEDGDVRELRRRVAMMAKMHDEAENAQAMMPHRMIPAVVTYEEIPNGTSLTLTPKDPAQLEAFRKEVRANVERMVVRMKDGDCPMMHGAMQGMMDRMPKHDAVPNGSGSHDSHHPQ